MNLSVIVLFSSIALCCGLWEGFAGPYYCRLQRILRCKDVGKDTVVFPTKLRRLNRTHHSYSVNLTVPFDLGNGTKIHILMESESTNHQWDNIVDWEDDTCHIFNNLVPYFVRETYRSVGINYTTTCPILKKGNYYLKDVPISERNTEMFQNFPLPFGQYRTEVSILRLADDDTRVREWCVGFLFQVRPLMEIHGKGLKV